MNAELEKQVSGATVGEKISASPEVRSLTNQLVQSVYQLNSEIDGVRAPRSDRELSSQKLVEAIGKVRGRPLYFPFVGTGAGHRCFVELEDGSVKLDLINGIGIHLMGHGNPRVMAAAVRGALSDVVNQGNLEPNKEYYDFLKKLTDRASRRSKLKYAWLSTCGTMANENALKISRQKRTPARMVLSFQNAFAGRSTLMAELTDNPAYKQGLPEYHEMLRMPFYDAKDPRSAEVTLRKMQEHVERHRGNISVFVFEPMLGEGGYIAPPREFFLPLLDFCRSQKIPVWMDEVQTFSRTGELFAFETLGLEEYVDLCSIAKTAQVGATLYTEEMNPAPGLIAGTFSGASAALAAGSEILEMLDEGYFGREGKIQRIHQKFVDMLQRLNETTCRGLLKDAGGLGLMIAVTPYDGKKELVEPLVKRLFKKGLICYNCGKDPMRLRFLIPAVISDSDIELAGKILEAALLET
ncbi:MAG: aminotransferase class III-fold pyridoxal phosphate-dependent enzyme [Bdellovibrio sp.]